MSPAMNAALSSSQESLGAAIFSVTIESMQVYRVYLQHMFPFVLECRMHANRQRRLESPAGGGASSRSGGVPKSMQRDI